MVKKDLQTELRELEEKKQEIEKEIIKKRAEKENQDKKKQEKWERKLEKIKESCDGKIIDEWYDYDELGYKTFNEIINDGFYASYLEDDLEVSQQVATPKSFQDFSKPLIM